MLCTLQPCLNQRQHIGLWVVVAGDSAFLCEESIRLAEPFGGARMDPEDRHFRVLILKPVCAGQGNLSFAAACQTCNTSVITKTYPAPPKPYSATLDPNTAWRWLKPSCCLRSSSVFARPTKSGFRLYGTRTKPLLSTTHQSIHHSLHTLYTCCPSAAMLRQRPSRKAPQPLANLIVLVVLWAEFNHIRMRACDSTHVLRPVFSRTAMRRGKFSN